jgi:hypothetical protein
VRGKVEDDLEMCRFGDLEMWKCGNVEMGKII